MSKRPRFGRSLAVCVALAAVLAITATALARETTLPAGTLVPIRLETTVSSASARPEETVIGVVRTNVIRGGQVVIPAGSEVRGHVVSARRSGRVKGRAYLAVRFTEIRIQGRRYDIASAPLARQARKTHGRDAKIIGGGTGAGAVIGAIAGGKKGAVKGGLIGGAAGTGVVLSTRGKEVTFPAGGRYRLRLTKPLVLV
jgi:hypothetical protein